MPPRLLTIFRMKRYCQLPGPLTVYGQLNVRNINEVGKTLIIIIINNIKIAININISIESTNMNSNIIQADDPKMVISLEVSLR